MNYENLCNSAFSKYLLFNLWSQSGIAVWQEWYTECTASRIYSEVCTIQSALQFKRILYIESLEDSPKLLRRFIDGPWLLGLEPLTRKKPFLCNRIDCFLLCGKRYRVGKKVLIRTLYFLNQSPLDCCKILKT